MSLNLNLSSDIHKLFITNCISRRTSVVSFNFKRNEILLDTKKFLSSESFTLGYCYIY